MEEKNCFTKKKKGIKVTLMELHPDQDVIFPRPSFSSVRNIISTLKVEYPDRQFNYSIIENGIRVLCLK